MASTDAKPFAIKNTAYRVTFPILDADGDLVTGATGLDSELSKDGGTFADCTNEATEIATASGMYYLDLTSTEMNADTVAVIVKTTSSGAKTTALVFYPLEDSDIRVNAVQWAGTATATDDIALKATLAKGTDITGFNDIAAGAAMTLTSAYDAAKTAATQASVNAVDDFVDTEVAAIKTVTDKLDTALVLDGAVYQYTANALELSPAGGGGGGDASQATLLAVKAKTDALPSDPADASDIAASFAGVNTKLDTIDDFVDTEITAIKAKTDQLTFTGGKVDANATTAIVAGDLTAIADAVLKRDWTAISSEAVYSLLNAARMLRNSWSTAGGVLVVKKEDGSTNAWSRPLAVDPTAQPIVGAS